MFLIYYLVTEEHQLFKHVESIFAEMVTIMWGIILEKVQHTLSPCISGDDIYDKL